MNRKYVYNAFYVLAIAAALIMPAAEVYSAGNAPATAAGVVDAPADLNGDGKTDYIVVRAAGGATGQLTWYTQFSGLATFSQTQWGTASDFLLTPVDYDGDGKDDISVWRPGAAGAAGFYIFHSGDSSFRFVQFGQTNDDPSVVTDYTGDGKADPAIYRSGAQGTFWYLASSGPLAGQPVATSWGVEGDIPVPGDYTGDGKGDFCVFRNVSGQAVYFIHPGTGGGDAPGNDVVTYFGLALDLAVPGDYDGDGKTDLAVVRTQGADLVWYYTASSTGNFVGLTWGKSSTDVPVQGDYDGDGKTDVGVWRRTSPSTFFVFGSAAGVIYQTWGLPADLPGAYDAHGTP